MATEFRIDLLDSTGARVGDGPLDTVQLLEDTRSLDAIGALTFAIPAEDERAAYIVAGAQFDAYDRVDGYLGRFYYRTKRLDAGAAGGARLVVQAHNQLIELARQSVHFRLTYNAQAVDDVVQDLVEMASGWTDSTDASIGTTSVMYEGESILRAIDVLRDRWNKHYRLGNSRVLEFGAFGSDSGVVLTNLKGQVQSEIDSNRTLAIVERISLVEEADEIYNKLIPLGAGQGVAQLTIETATLGTYAVQTGTNDDGSSYFYIENAASVVSYGRRERILTLPQIRPITNSDANILNAANALKLSAEAYLARHLAPRVTYNVTVRALRTEISVGDLVRLQYRGIVDNYAFINVDEYFYVMDVVRSRLADGTRSASLNIASIAERRTADTDIMLDVISDLKALKINVPITLTKDRVGPYVKRINSSNAAEFTVFIGDEVTFLNYAKVRFRTSTLKSSVTTVSTASSSSPTTSSGGSSSPTSSSGGGATVTSASGGGATVTSASGGSSTPTSSSGGSATVTSAAGGNHFHEIPVAASGPTGYSLWLTTGGVVFWSHGSPGAMISDAAVDHTHDITIGSHTHDVTISSHTHGVTISSHTHDVTISAHTHTVSISAHTHTVDVAGHNHNLTYGLYADTVYPQVISLSINGVNVTTALGGTWAPTNASVEVEVDITTYLVNAVGGLRQNHRISFSCASGQGEIECDVNTLESIQAIAVS